MNASSNALAGGVTIANRFRLVRPLSTGGMGSVWIATHTTLGTEVAIKFVDIRGEASESLRRFEREANLVARLRSPHVVQILDYGVDEAGRPYLAMELLNGESLKQCLDRTKTLRLAEVATVVVHTCRALYRAHKAGVVHRDIKPANIFLTQEDDSLHVKVLDFGVAKSNGIQGPSDAQKTETGALVGTPAYMSPEQVLGSAEIDGRSDLFSLGVLAWRALVGFNPHERDGKPLGVGELLIQIATKPVPAPSQYVQGVSPEVDAWFARALALNPSDRFATAKEMADALVAATHIASLNTAATGQFTVASMETSGAHPIGDASAFQDSDDARRFAPLAALVDSGQTPSPLRGDTGRTPSPGSGERQVLIQSSQPAPAAPRRSRDVVLLLAAVVLLLVVAGFALRNPSPPPPPVAGGSPSAAASVPPSSPPAVSAEPEAPPAAAASSVAASAPASATPAAQPSRPPPRGATPAPAAPKADPTKKPSSPNNTLLDDRL